MKTRATLVTLAILVMPLMVTAGFSQAKKPSSTPARPVADYGKYNFTFTTLDGKKIALADYAGKVVLVNVWAPWCSPCRKETPGFVNLYKQFKSKGFEILGVAVQTNEGDVRAFIQQYKPTWPIGIKDEVARSYGTYGLPDSYLFRPDGSLVKRLVGYAREEALIPLIEEALKLVPRSGSK